MNTKLLVWCLILCMGSSHVFGQADQFRFVSFGTRDGLNDKYVYAATQDKQGFMWFGLATGLYRFDGYNFRHYSSTADKPGQSISNVLQTLQTDEAGHLWLGSLNTLQWYNPVSNRFWTPDYSQPALREMGGSYFLNISKGHNGNMWLATQKNYFYRFSAKDSSFTPFHQYPKNASRTTIRVFEIGQSIYALHPEGIYIFTTDGKPVAFHPMPIDEISNGFYNSKEQTIIITTYTGGLVVFSLPQKKFLSNRYPNEEFKKSNLFCATIDPGGKLLVGAYALFRYDDSTKELLTFRRDAKNEYSLNAEKIGNLFFDRENNLWVCSHNGLSMLPWQNTQIKSIPLVDVVTKNGVEPTGVMMVPGSDDILIPNTNSAGLLVYNTTSKKVITVQNTYSKKQSDKPIVSLFLTPDNKVFLSDYKQLYIYETASRSMKPYLLRDQNGKQVANTGRTVFDKKGNIYIYAFENGFYMWDYSNNKVVHYNKWDIDPADSNKKDNYFAPSLIDRDGFCWFSSSNGVYRFNPQTQKAVHIGTTELPSVPVMGRTQYIAEDKRGHIWIATDANGIYEWYTEGGKEILRNYNRYSGIGLPVDYCWKIKADPRDSMLWISNTVGLLRFDPVAKRVVSILSKQNGFSVDDGGYSFNILPNGQLAQLYFGYLNLIDLNSFQYNTIKPVVQLSSLQVLDQEKLFTLDTLHPELYLSNQENFLRFQFAALVYNNSNRNQYALQLEGADKDWIYVESKNIASYSGLKPGTYYFRVKAANSDGLWGPETVVKIVTRPPFYATTWFIGLCILSILAMSFFWNRYRIGQVRKQEALQSAFRQQIAETEMKALRAQMNPHFIFNSLNSIQKYILKNEHIEASQYLTKFSRLIRLILDQSNQNTILLSSELDLLKLYLEMESLRFDNTFDYSITAEASLAVDTTEIPSMLVQPYVENAIWHGLLHLPVGERGVLQIHFSATSDGSIKILIDDNGVGREKAREWKSKQVLKKKSYGMQIAEDRIAVINRMQHIHATCEVVDKKNADGSAAGTSVILVIPPIKNQFA